MSQAIHQLSRLLLYMSKSFQCNQKPIQFYRQDTNQKEVQEVHRFQRETLKQNMPVYKIQEYADDSLSSQISFHKAISCQKAYQEKTGSDAIHNSCRAGF